MRKKSGKRQKNEQAYKGEGVSEEKCPFAALVPPSPAPLYTPATQTK